MRSSFLILFFLLFGMAPKCFAQKTISISDPRIEKTGQYIRISYDILNSTPSDRFTIEISITDADGRRIQAHSLEGDVGENVEGGNNKEVKWDIEKDAIQLKANIYIEIIAERVTVHEKGGFNRTSLILQSLAFPGLGMTRYTGNPHWIRGVAGYGCLAGSIILNKAAVNTYNSVAEQVDFDEKVALYETSISQDRTSQVLAYAAVGIWLADLVWNMVGTSNLKKGGSFANRSGFSMGSGLDPVAMVPVVQIRFGF